MRLDPKLFEAPYYWGRNLMWQGKMEEALRIFRVALALRPESYDVATMIAQTYTALGKESEALSARRRALTLMEERLDLNPDDARAWMLASGMYATLGDAGKAENAIRRALAIDPDTMTYYNVACAYALMNEPDKSLDALEAAIDRGYHHKEWLSHDTDLDSIRNTERYARLIERIDARSQ
jgi:tetratricopeptide (TPR) repeat protein